MERSSVRHETFFVGGKYGSAGTMQIMTGQMYVEVLTPERVRQPYPLVLIHGLSQTANTWLTTPDGRKGWAECFTDFGWKVYLVDQPARGRSATHPPTSALSTVIPPWFVEREFTAPEDFGGWPQAKLHTQWPGGPKEGHMGDPVFDQFYASFVPSLGYQESETLMREAGTALLEKIGPAVLMVHSQGGLFAWLIGDARPKLVKGIVAVEPSGPPYKNVGARPDATRPWGLTHTPLTYDPPVTTEAPLELEQQGRAEGENLVACWLQKGTPRKLPNLAEIPILIVTGEASHHAPFDHCTSRYLEQAGVANDFMRLDEHGIRGNAHMMMMEKNNVEIAALLHGWMKDNINDAFAPHGPKRADDGSHPTEGAAS
jgi:pimeloyl-ACP methyl ester carboxylesterase